MRKPDNFPLTTTAILVAAGLIALSAPAARAQITEPGYTPTMKDMMSIQATFHRYKMGLDKHDAKLLGSAFTVDGEDEIIDNGKAVNKSIGRVEIGQAEAGAPGGGAPGGPGGAGPGGAGPGGAGGPPGGGAGGPPSGAAGGAPGGTAPGGAGGPPGGTAGGAPSGAPGGAAPGGTGPGGAGGMPSGGPGGAAPGGAGGMGDLWHLSTDDYFNFDSPTHATHYAYWFDFHSSGRSSTVGEPGHYEDVLVKVNGDWLLKSRHIVVGTK